MRWWRNYWARVARDRAARAAVEAIQESIRQADLAVGEQLIRVLLGKRELCHLTYYEQSQNRYHWCDQMRHALDYAFRTDARWRFLDEVAKQEFVMAAIFRFLDQDTWHGDATYLGRGASAKLWINMGADIYRNTCLALHRYTEDSIVQIGVDENSDPD